MIRNTYYNIDDKLNKKIALFSDIHYSYYFNRKKFNKIYDNLEKNKPDYICIPGDIVNDVSVLDEKEYKNILTKFIKKIALLCPVIIIPGNHDQIRITSGKIEYNKKYFESLNKIKKVYYLDNKNVIIDDINFIGLNVDMKYYSKNESIDVLNDSLKNIKTVNNKYNILMFHSPVHITKLDDNLKNINLILAGHMHNGMVLSPFLRLKGNTGFIGPYYNLFPENARGRIDYEDKTLVISGGITKLSNKKLKLIDNLLASDIEYISI